MRGSQNFPRTLSFVDFCHSFHQVSSSSHLLPLFQTILCRERNTLSYYFKMTVRKFLIQGLFLLSLFFFGSSVRYDCCQPQLSSTGLGCTPSGTYFSNQTYYCVSVAEICPSCKISAFENITSSSCYQCCATGPESCGISVSFISTSSWSKCIESIRFIIHKIFLLTIIIHRFLLCFLIVIHSINMHYICRFMLLLFYCILIS